MSHSDELKRLITTYKRRLQKLKQQEALQGISVDPKIPLEIEDIETKIAELQDQLQDVQKQESEENSISSVLAISSRSKRIQIPTAIWVAIIGASATVFAVLIPVLLPKKASQPEILPATSTSIVQPALPTSVSHSTVPTSVTQSKKCLSNTEMEPLQRLSECEYEFGWVVGTVNGSNFHYVKVTDVITQESASTYFPGFQIVIKHEDGGVLEGSMIGNEIIGTWYQEDKYQGEFELYFNTDFTEATGWWNDKTNPTQKFSARLSLVGK